MLKLEVSPRFSFICRPISQRVQGDTVMVKQKTLLYFLILVIYSIQEGPCGGTAVTSTGCRAETQFPHFLIRK